MFHKKFQFQNVAIENEEKMEWVSKCRASSLPPPIILVLFDPPAVSLWKKVLNLFSSFIQWCPSRCCFSLSLFRGGGDEDDSCRRVALTHCALHYIHSHFSWRNGLYECLCTCVTGEKKKERRKYIHWHSNGHGDFFLSTGSTAVSGLNTNRGCLSAYKIIKSLPPPVFSFLAS